MTMEKIAVSLPYELVAKARKAVKQGVASSVSAYVAQAIEEKAGKDDLQLMLDEMLAETGGPMTEAERKSVDKLLGIKPKTKKRKR